MLYSLSQILEFSFVTAVGVFLATPLLLLNVRVAPTLGLIDWPKARGVAEEQIPIIGHSLVLLTLFLFSSISAFGGFSSSGLNGQYVPSMIFTVTAAIVAIMGHFDDRKPLPAIDKLFLQILCSTFVVFLDPNLRLAITERYGIWGSCLSVVFLIGLMNAVNFIDGIDGLAGLVLSFGFAGVFFINSGSINSLVVSLVSLLAIGMFIPFLYINVIRRKGFLGNVGSYFFAYVLGVLHLSLPIDTAGPVSRLALAGLCFLVPIADGVSVILMRLLSGRSPFQPDKGHLHHRLIQSSLPLRYALLHFGAISAAGLVVVVAVIGTDGLLTSYLPGAALLSLLSVTALLIALIENASKRRVQLYLNLLDQGKTLYCLKYRIRKPDGSPIPYRQLKRLDARMNTEIRISDLCYMESPDTLVVALKTVAEPVRGIAARLDQVFQAESEKLQVTVEQQEFVKSEPVKVLKTIKKSA